MSHCHRAPRPVTTSGQRITWRIAAAIAAVALGACANDKPSQPSSASGTAHVEPLQTPTPAHAEIVPAPGDGAPIPALVQEQAERARREGRALLVYVGAPWCEPCTRFHDAVKAGELDATFPTLRLLEFDNDRDRERLAEAGYGSRMIPLFVAPAADGRASPLRIEGSIKGDGAVKEIVPRLQTLLAQARAAAH